MDDSHYSPDINEQEKIEKRDVKIAAIFISLGALAFFIIASIVASVFTFRVIEDYLNKNDVTTAPMFEAKIEPPQPRLQVTPKQDLKDLQAEQKKMTEEYLILDPAAGIARIPVSRAMEMLAEKPDLYVSGIRKDETKSPEPEQEAPQDAPAASAPEQKGPAHEA